MLRQSNRSLLESVALVDQGAFENHSSFFVALRFFRGEFVHPAEFSIALLTADIANEMTASEHHLNNRRTCEIYEGAETGSLLVLEQDFV